MRTPTLFPQDFQIRPATMEDLGAVVQLLTACDLADSGEPQWSEEGLRSLWQADDVQVETDTWIVVAPMKSSRAMRRSDAVGLDGFARSCMCFLPTVALGLNPICSNRSRRGCFIREPKCLPKLRSRS